MDVSLRVLNKGNKSRFHNYSVRNSVLIMSEISFWDCPVRFFRQHFSKPLYTVYERAATLIFLFLHAQSLIPHMFFFKILLSSHRCNDGSFVRRVAKSAATCKMSKKLSSPREKPIGVASNAE